MPENNPQALINDEIFKRDWYEVYLLLDFVSGRTGVSLADLGDIPVPGALVAAATPAKAQNAAELLRSFCEIVYPPPSDNVREKAANAALMLNMKDKLNSLASPAKGLTIAYTSMFTVGPAHTLSLWRWASSLFRRMVGRRQTETEADRTSRVTLAREAYPGLEWSAAVFSRFFGIGLPLIILFLFAATATTYWDVSFGRSLLQRIEQLDSATLPSGGRISVEGCKAAPANGVPAVCAALLDSAPDLKIAREALAKFRTAIGECSWSGWLEFLCAPKLLRPVWWGFQAYGLSSLDKDGPLVDQLMASFLALFSSYVLPMMFGLLGTLASMVRTIQAKVRDFVLAPRDLPLTLLGLLLGPLAGFAIGLYYSPSDTPAAGTGGLAGGVILTASGLSFLAGYGADSFFKMLDALLVRVFSLDPSKG